jgi:hypothetical protein
MLSESLGLPRAPLRGPFVNGPYQVPESQAPRALLSGTNPGRNIFLGRQTATAESTHRSGGCRDPRVWRVTRTEETESFLSDPRALKLGSIGVSSFWKEFF